MHGRDVELFVAAQQGDEMDAYERLISSAMIGDTAHFARQDEVEAAWAIVDPVLGTDSPVYEYTPGTWGPAEADSVISVGPCSWHNPGADPQSWTRSCGRGEMSEFAP
jgi:glucose-6-phosphate 1-dehydrogenase